MNKCYVEIFPEKERLYTTIESFLTIYLYKYLGNLKDVQIIYIQGVAKPNQSKIELKLKDVEITDIGKNGACVLNHLRLPVLSSGCTSISGLCAVSRELIKQTYNPDRKTLLGFKEGCLIAPSECSLWTKFCEIDIIAALNYILHTDFTNLSESDCFKIPEAITRFEGHMSQPVRIHNIHKVIQDEGNKARNKEESLLESLKKIEQEVLSHNFAEGYFFSLADLLLFPCFTIMFDILPYKDRLQKLFPLTFIWLNRVSTHDILCTDLVHNLVSIDQCSLTKEFGYEEANVVKTSLYKCDPRRYKPKDRIYTKQDNIDESLLKLATLNIQMNSKIVENIQSRYDWSLVTEVVYRNFGDIPDSRLVRKKQQLENLANAVISLANDGDVIVDFCSGSGHLGILIALALPKCHIIFLENKAQSLERAQKRVANMNLANCSFYQSNIDYFEGSFDIGTSLHACGTATDIVLKRCIERRAKFVCCPCCYGSINPMPHITYPLSTEYKSVLTEKDYLFIAHAADQSHNVDNTPCNLQKSNQGEFCMDAIDTDRKLMAEEAGYKVVLTRLKPEDCTTKNRLLIGKI